MATGDLHVGVVGVGRIGSLHASSLLALDGVAAVTLADADPVRAREVATMLGAQIVDIPESLLDAGVDALVIATPTPAHAPLLRLAADAGLPAVCEKPVALEVSGLGGAPAIVSGARQGPLGYDVRPEVFGCSDSVGPAVCPRTPLRSLGLGAPRARSGYRRFLEPFERAYREELAVFVATVRQGGASA